MHLELKSHRTPYVYNVFLGQPIILKFCTKHGSDTVVLGIEFQNVWTIETDVMNERD